MDFYELKEVLLEIVEENDPYRASKELQIKNWCYAFMDLFSFEDENDVEFFMDVLIDAECWEEVDTIHGIKLNRRIAARKVIQQYSWSGRRNPLELFLRYQIACWCCLKEDVTALFEEMRPKNEEDIDDTTVVKKYTKSLIKDYWSDPLVCYWTYIVGGCASELQSSSKHLYEYGIEQVLSKYVGYVEAVEFFWNEIKSLPEEEMSVNQKHEIFMKTSVRAAGTHIGRYPEIFEFCVSQLSPDKYPELLRRDFAQNLDYGSLTVLQNNLCFDKFEMLFDYLNPYDVSEKMYHRWLMQLEIEEYAEYYAMEAVKLFMHIWMKKGYDKHRNRVLIIELTDLAYRGTLLVSFVKKNYMEPVWALLDKAHPDHINSFMNSAKASYICSVLRKRRDTGSLDTFLSYKYIVCGLPKPTPGNAYPNETPDAKRRKTE